MTGPSSINSLSLDIDRASAAPIGDQIFQRLKTAIISGQLPVGGRLPSGRDLAAQLGVARGTVRTAFDRLADENLIYGAGAAGMRIAAHSPVQADLPHTMPAGDRPLLPFGRPQQGLVLPFQMGVPSQTGFPLKVWHRILATAARDDVTDSRSYPDPQGELDLRVQITRHLAISRHIHCHPDQVIITSGYRQGLALTLSAMAARGSKAWGEDPGYPLGRRALELAGVTVVPIAVDQEGVCVDEAIAKAPDAKIALVTPGQQAPLGVSLSIARRQALIRWAQSRNTWIIEDDYLSELQLDGRATPALASDAGGERVVHIGSFSKTLSPSLGLGFVIAPPTLVGRMIEAASVTAPAPARVIQKAMTTFLAEGQYLRHVRKMKALYTGQRAMITERLQERGIASTPSGLALIVPLPDTDDVTIARNARERGIAPVPLSLWHSGAHPKMSGLLLSVTNVREANAAGACNALFETVTPKLMT